MNYKKTTLKNGLRVITVPMKDTQTVTVVVMVGVGSRYENEREAGLSHFVEHMFLKGTKRRPSWAQIAKEIDSMGGEHNAFTSKDATRYYTKADSKHVDAIFDIIADIYLNSIIDQKEIKKEKGAIIQELKMYEDDPKRKAEEIFENLLYGKNPLGRDIVGYEKTLNSFKRNDLIGYVRKHYLANDTVVCVAGKFNEKKVIKNAEKYFAKMKKGKKPRFIKVKEGQNKAAAEIKFKKTEQTTLIVGNRAYHENHKDRFALSLLSIILGGNTSSRMFSEIREKRGLAYYVRTGIEAFNECGYIATQAGVDHKNLNLTLRTIIGECKKIATEKVDRGELQRAKDYIKGSSVMGLEASDSVAMFFADQEITRRKIMTLEQIFARIDKVTANDILKVAKDIFRENTLNLAVIGPHRNEEKLRKLLKF